MSFFSWFCKCFYQRQAILASRFRPTIQVLGHVCLTVLVAMLPFCIILSLSIWSGINDLEHALSHQDVSFTIHDGQLETPINPTPHSIETDTLVVVVDPDEIHAASIAEVDTLLLHRKEANLTISGFHQDITYALLGDGTVSDEEIVNQLESFRSSLPILLPILVIIIQSFGIGFAFLGSSILALVALPFFTKKKNIQYIHLWKLSVHVLPFPLLLYAWNVTWIDQLPLSWFFVLYLGLYIYFLIKLAHKKKSRKTS